mgnify:CR=1 FL=1
MKSPLPAVLSCSALNEHSTVVMGVATDWMFILHHAFYVGSDEFCMLRACHTHHMGILSLNCIVSFGVQKISVLNIIEKISALNIIENPYACN